MRLMVLVVVVASACAGSSSPGSGASSSSSGSPTSSSSVAVSASSTSSSTSGTADAGVTLMEHEPNNADQAGEINAVDFPSTVTGAIDPADDLDVLSATLQAGQLWAWRLRSTNGTFAPHLAVAKGDNHTPVMVAVGGAGDDVVQWHFVLESGAYNFILRDARNVPASSSQHAGSPDHRWELSGAMHTAEPQMVTFPSTVQGTLDTPTSVKLYRFTGTPAMGFDIVLRAARLAPPSEMDSRMSLFDLTAGTWIITNDDDAAEDTLDSHIGGDALPSSGDYMVIVENVAAAPSSLSYTLTFSLR